MSTTIEWADDTVNIVTGCEKVSPGCDNCYAATWAARGMGQWKDRDFGTVLCHEDRLPLLLAGKVPRRKFVCSMADLFHRAVPDEFLERAFAVMYDAVHCPHRHTIQILTKRPERMRRIVKRIYARWGAQLRDKPSSYAPDGIWLGVSVESNDYAWRIDMLRETPAAVRFLSCEPLLAPLDLHGKLDGIHWCIIGGESGPRSRPLDLAWVRGIIAACREQNVAVFVKQLGSVWSRDYSGPSAWRMDSKGGNMHRFPVDLQIREFPQIASAA